MALQGMLTAKLFKPSRSEGHRRSRAGRESRARGAGDRQPDPQSGARSRGTRRRWRTRRPAAVHDRRGRGDRQGRQGLQGAVLHLPRPRWPGRSAGWRSGRHDHGAAARQLAARAGAPRLRDQDAAPRHDRPARRQDLPGRCDDAVRDELRRVDRQHRILRAQQLRQPRPVRDHRRRRSRARRNRRAQDDVDAGGARGVAATTDARSTVVEGDAPVTMRRPRRVRSPSPRGTRRRRSSQGCGSRWNCPRPCG